MTSEDRARWKRLLEFELAAGSELLNALSVADRIRLRSAVDALSRAIEEIRGERVEIAISDPDSRLGPLLAEKIREVEDLRLRLLYAVEFEDFELTVGPSRSGDVPNEDGNICRDGELLAHAPLFDLE